MRCGLRGSRASCSLRCRRGGFVRLQRGTEVAAQVVDFADQQLRPGPAAQRVGVGLAEITRVIVGEGALADSIEHVETTDRVETRAQVGQHELHESLGVLACRFGIRLRQAGGVALTQGVHGQPSKQDDERCEPCGKRTQAARPPLVLALDKFVEPGAGKAGDQLRHGKPPAVSARPQVRGHRLRAHIRHHPIGADVKTQRLGKALRCRVA